MFNKTGLWAAVAIMISGCTLHDKGQVDYRLHTRAEQAPCEVSGVRGNCLQDIIHQTVYHSNKAEINAGDTIAIRLKRAFINDFVEISIDIPNTIFKESGEIAVTSRVGTDLDLTSINNIPEDARVVYYSSDVEEGQFLNFFNMPIYGPITYDGSPLQMEISMLEMDTGSEQAKQMFSALAKLGGKAYPPADPMLKALENLSKTFIDTQGDENTHDLAFQIIGGFDSSDSHPNNPYYARPVAGDYVYIRTQDRSETPDWGNLCLDVDTAILYKKDDSKKCDQGEPYKDNTYMVVQVLKNLSASTIDQAQGFYKNSTGLSSLMSKYREFDENAAKEMNDATEKALSYQTRMYNFDKMRQLSNRLGKNIQNITSAQCTFINLHNAKKNVTKLVSALTKSFAGDEQYELTAEQKSYLSTEILDIFSIQGASNNLIQFSGEDVGTGNGAKIADIINEINYIKDNSCP